MSDIEFALVKFNAIQARNTFLSKEDHNPEHAARMSFDIDNTHVASIQPDVEEAPPKQTIWESFWGIQPGDMHHSWVASEVMFGFMIWSIIFVLALIL